MSQFQQEFITTAIEHYGLELEDDYRSETLSQRFDLIVVTWFQNYDPAWVVKALIESLYRGRYKVKSVDNILRDWQRRGSPFYKFTPDYEREILHSLRLNIDHPITATPSAIPPAPVSTPESELPVSASQLPHSEQLDPEESAPFQHHDRSISAARSTSDRDTNLSADLDRTMLGSAANAKTLERAISLASSLDRNIDPELLDIDRRIPPEKLYLFNKLRAIVEPSSCHNEGIQHSV